MVGSLIGDMRACQQISDACLALSNRTQRGALNDLLGQEAMRLIEREFDNSKDPYGKPWKPLKKRRGQILVNTGYMVNSRTYRANSLGFMVVFPVIYARRHNFGFEQTPQRMFVPPSDNLGPTWIAAFEAVAAEYISEAFAQWA